MLSNPIGEGFLCDNAIGECQDFGNDLGVGRRELVAI